MIGAAMTFFVLLGAIKLFERGRDDLDGFVVASVAVVPVLVTVLVQAALGLLYPEPLLQMLLPPLALIALTFGLLWKQLEIHVGRAIGYTALVVIVNVTLALLLG